MIRKCECGDIHKCSATWKEQRTSYVDDAVIVLRKTGRSLGISELVLRIRERRNNPAVTRAAVETSLLRHIGNKGKSTVLIKAGKGIYSVTP